MENNENKIVLGRGRAEAKARDVVGDEVVDALLGMGADELRERLGTLAQHEVETEDARARDEAIQQTKAELKEMLAPYRETLSGIGAQRKLIALLLEERGTVAQP